MGFKFKKYEKEKPYKKSFNVNEQGYCPKCGTPTSFLNEFHWCENCEVERYFNNNIGVECGSF